MTDASVSLTWSKEKMVTATFAQWKARLALGVVLERQFATEDDVSVATWIKAENVCE